MEHEYHYEDLVPGMVLDLPEYHVTKEEIIDFASQFDPAPFHLDEESGRNSMLGGLAASGWHVCSISMAMMCKTFIARAASQGSPGVKECKWLRPVFAGDTLTGKLSVESKRESTSRPNLGFVEFRCTLANQTGEDVMTFVNTGMMLKRGAA